MLHFACGALVGFPRHGYILTGQNDGCANSQYSLVASPGI